MVAGVLGGDQTALEIGLNERGRFSDGDTSEDCDAMLLEEVLGASAYPSDEDDLHTFAVEPVRQNTGGVGRSGEVLDVQDALLGRIHLNQSEMGRVPEMATEFSVLDRHGNPHEVLLILGVVETVF